MIWQSLQYSLNVTLSVILLMILGIAIRHFKFVDDHFCQTAAKVIFHFTLPCLLFLNVYHSTLNYQQELNLILAGVMGTFLLYVGAEWWASKHIFRPYRCIFTQGVFRTNAAILGMALVKNAYGEEGLASASIYTAFLIMVFNILGVMTILRSLSEQTLSWGKLFYAVIRNPLIIAIAIGLIFQTIHAPMPQPIMQTIQALSHLTLPLALICIGASIDFKALIAFKNVSSQERELNRVVLFSAIMRLSIAPLFMLLLGKYVFLLNPMQLGILFLMASAPVATAVYAMVRAYGGNGTAAANLIGLTTLGAIFSTNIGLFILKQMNWI